MKNIKKSLAGLALLVALPLGATNYVFIAGNNNLDTKLCIAASQDNLSKYKRIARALSPNRLEHRMLSHKIHTHLAANLQCNNQSVLAFARQYDADRTSSFLTRYSEHEVLINREISQLSPVGQNIDDATVYVLVN